MKQIRIAHIVGKWNGGGVETVIMNYYKNIDRSKIQFDFICDNDSKNIPYDEIKKLGGRIFLIPPYQKVLKYHKELKRILKKNNYEIVHSHINTLSVFSLYAAKKANVPIRIAHSHSTTNKKEWKKNILKQLLRPFSKKYATNYMACAKDAGIWLFGKKKYINNEIYILNNAIDIKKFKYNKKDRIDIRNKYNIEDDTVVLGHSGRFVKQKNHEFLIDVFKEYNKVNNNSKLLLVGDGQDFDKIKNKIDSLELTNKVILTGFVTDPTKYYQAMDIFLFPSLYEGLGISLIEAQISGLPCIASEFVPKEAAISNIIRFEKLDNTDKWCNDINELLKTNRKENKPYNQDYDITKESIKLEQYYIDQLEVNKNEK